AAVGDGSAVEYAATLLAWFRLGSERHTAAALAFGGRPSQLKRRIAMLLNPEWRVETRCPGRWRWGLGALAGLGVLALSGPTLLPAAPAAAEEPAPPKPAAAKEEPKPVPPARGREEMKMMKPDRKPVGKSYVAAILAGKVLGPDGKPAAGAAVGVVAWSKNDSSGRTEILGQTKTDAQGQFRLETMCPVPATQYEVVTVATAKGCGPGWATGLSPDMMLHLAPEQLVRGRLIDLQGQPAAGVKLHVSRVGSRPVGAHDGIYRAILLDPSASLDVEEEGAAEAA